MDVSSMANTLAWLIELYEEGIIDKSFTQDHELVFSSPRLIEGLIKDTAYRRGFGDVVAQGPRRILESLPPEAEEYLCWTKKLVQSEPADLRYLPAFALSNSVATRGSDHLRSRPIWVAFEFPQESLEAVYGEAVDASAFSYEGKGVVIFWWENYLAMFDILGMCKFLGFHTLPPGIEFSVFSELIRTAVGEEFSQEELKEVGERVLTIERMYLEREGVARCDDYPPQKVFKLLKERDKVREEDRDLKLDKDKYDAMLDEYYQRRGLSSEGRVKKETITRLNLEEALIG